MKKFSAVEMMREIRDRLHEKYEKDPELREKNLDKIRIKYKIKAKSAENKVQ